MKRPHRPFWILRHLVTGRIKKVPSYDSEDGMWEVLLTDGSGDSDLVGTIPSARRPSNASTPRSRYKDDTKNVCLRPARTPVDGSPTADG
jgi:hypothetical protein